MTLASGLPAAPLAAGAQQPTKIPRAGFLQFNRIELVRPLFEAFREGLRERGWVEGQNIIIEYRSAEGRQDRLPHVAAELVRLKVDVIIGAGSLVAVAAKNATKTIPIVMVAVDPVGMGLVPSLARPGGNITGVATFTTRPVERPYATRNRFVPRIPSSA